MNPRASITTVSDLHRMLYDEDMKPGALPLSVLSKITDNFSEELIIGYGGFAEVYKGIVENDLVAVKKITEESMDEKEYKRELECLLSVKHKNIVRFLGYCGDTQWDMRRNKGKIVKSNKEKRLLCFEYVPNGALDGCIKDPSTGLAWKNRYMIIKGICEGLAYLHQINILHLDLKPGNILLGENEVPKITDFGLSRYFREDKAYVTATKEVGTRGYMAPEFNSKRITKKFDLYSLGVLIIEIITGKKGYQAVHEVLESWNNRLDVSHRNSEWEQIKVCTEIGIQCTDFDPANRPDSMKDIMDRLAEMESLHVIPAAGGQRELLEVHPPVLYFPFESNKVIPCSLHLTNNANEQVAFRLMDRSNKSGSCFVRLPLCGLVPPRSTYTLVLTTEERNEVERRNICMILKITIQGDEHIEKFQSDTFFEDVKEMGNEVQEVKLIGGHTHREEIISSKPISPVIDILDMGKWYKQTSPNEEHTLGQNTLYCMDTCPAKQWILTGGSHGHVGIWSYQTKRKVDSLKVSLESAVTCVKFIARKQWLVAAADDVHVYSYGSKLEKINSFSARCVKGVSLAVHPTQPYLLTVSDDGIEIWNWDKDWQCTRLRFKRAHRYTRQVTFNSKGIIAFAQGHQDVAVWNLSLALCSRASRRGGSEYRLSGHSKIVNCVEYFTCGGQEYLVSGSNDCYVKIWDMELKVCVCTLERLGSPVMSVVYQPNHQIIIAGSKDGSIYFWKTSNSRICSDSARLERIINIGYGGPVRSLACLMGRLVIGKEGLVAVAMLDDEDKNYQEDSTDYSEAVSTSQVMAGPGELLYVHPLELRFHGKRNEMCSLYITNKTNEHVAFRVIDRSGKSQWDRCFVALPLQGIVPSGSTCRLVVTTQYQTNLLIKAGLISDGDLDLVLQSSVLGDKNIVILGDEFFDEAKELGHAMHELALKFVCAATEREPKFKPVILPRMKIISLKKREGDLICLDAHLTEPWIITKHFQDVCIWNYDTQELVHKFEVPEYQAPFIKFIPNKQWIVALEEKSGDWHVYDCASLTQIKMKGTAPFRPLYSSTELSEMAVHPTKPLLLLSWAYRAELWDGDNGWECIDKFNDVGDLTAAVFNPDANGFASVTNVSSLVEVWNLDLSKRDDGHVHSMWGHSDTVNCLAYFTRGDRQYLITGSKDCTAKIWDLQERTCIHTLTGFLSPVDHVVSLPGHPYLVTCSNLRTVHVWSSTDFRLMKTVNLSGGGKILGLVCLMDSRRIAIGQANTITIMDIDDDDEEEAASKGNNEDSASATD